MLTFVHNAGTGDDNVLNQVDLTTISQDECRALDRYYANTLTNNMLCAGHMPGGQGTCFGDSGGPLVCNCGDRWWVHGVFSVVVWPLSNPRECAHSNWPPIFANVVSLLPWIEAKTGSQCDHFNQCHGRREGGQGDTTLGNSHVEKKLGVFG